MLISLKRKKIFEKEQDDLLDLITALVKLNVFLALLSQCMRSAHSKTVLPQSKNTERKHLHF